jgi:hypothetical protein
MEEGCLGGASYRKPAGWTRVAGAPTVHVMPLVLGRDASTVLIRRSAWERSGLARAEIDRRLNLTADEFRVEGSVIAVGPLFAEGQLEQLLALLEGAGLVYFEEFFELSGNWPPWLLLHAQGD